MIELTVNDKTCTIARPMTVTEFLAARGLHERLVVVEHNREIVARTRYAEVILGPGDEVEIVQMMAGG